MIYDDNNLNKFINYIENNNTMSPDNANMIISTNKRRSQVKNACVNCQKACKKCDEGRPCQRCIKLGITETCFDSPRKERKKGFKRGPYRKKSVTTQHINPKKELSSSPLYTSSILVKTNQISPSPISQDTAICMNNEYDEATDTSNLNNQSLISALNYYYNNISDDYYYTTSNDYLPQEDFTTTILPNPNFTDIVEHQLYYTTQNTSSFVPIFNGTAIYSQNDKHQHYDDSIYNDQQWLDNLYYHPSNMMYINSNPSSI